MHRRLLMNNIIKEKAHADGMGLSQYLADFLLATFADVADNEVLATLINTHENADIYKLHCDITIFSGQLEGQVQLDTANTLGLVMLNNKAEQVNLASIPLDDNGRIEPPRLYRRVIYLSQAAMPDRIKLS